MEETLLRWAVRRDQHKDPTLTPQPAVRKSYEEWHARYYLNPKHVAHSMRAALESVVQRSLRRNALYDMFFGPESDEDFEALQEFLLSVVDGWEPPRPGKLKEYYVTLIPFLLIYYL